jgi:predicted RecA/RadA family phage recombinase
MKNFIAPGKTISVITPAGGYVSGRGYVIGSLFGVANLTTAEGERNELSTDGVYALPGAGAAFATAYVDSTNGTVTDTADEGLYKIGVIVGVGTGTVEVRLDGVAVSAVVAEA